MKTVRARYSGGKLELLDAVDLPEGAVVSVTVEEAKQLGLPPAERFRRAAGSWAGSLDFDEFLAELAVSRRQVSRDIQL